MFNSLKRNLNIFSLPKKSESPKDSLFYSHPLPQFPPLLPLPPPSLSLIPYPPAQLPHFHHHPIPPPPSLSLNPTASHRSHNSYHSHPPKKLSPLPFPPSFSQSLRVSLPPLPSPPAQLAPPPKPRSLTEILFQISVDSQPLKK